jgi:hypothetical protein
MGVNYIPGIGRGSKSYLVKAAQAVAGDVNDAQAAAQPPLAKQAACGGSRHLPRP